MKIKSEIIYTDTIYYYKKPVPGYICSILSANDPDGKNLNILERDSELELEYILEPNTTMSDIRNDEKVKELLAPLKECGPYIIWDDLDRSIQIAKNIPKSFCEKDLELIWQCVKEVDERVLVEANKLENER